VLDDYNRATDDARITDATYGVGYAGDLRLCGRGDR
jgi:hypothetical protein